MRFIRLEGDARWNVMWAALLRSFDRLRTDRHLQTIHIFRRGRMKNRALREHPIFFHFWARWLRGERAAQPKKNGNISIKINEVTITVHKTIEQ